MSKAKTTKEFFEEWQPYDLLVTHNYMRHQEMIDCLRKQWLEAVKPESSLLELGCGNAFVVSEALGDQRGLKYTGIDLSETALSAAEQRLSTTDWSIDLIEGDIIACIENLDQTFDCIVSGFSLHHFSPSQTLGLLRKMRSLLKPGGLTVIYDILTREGETREDFLERLIAGADFDGFGFSQSQSETVSEHVRGNDYPVSLSTWESWAKDAEFREVTCVYRDAEEYYGFLILN